MHDLEQDAAEVRAAGGRGAVERAAPVQSEVRGRHGAVGASCGRVEQGNRFIGALRALHVNAAEAIGLAQRSGPEQGVAALDHGAGWDRSVRAVRARVERVQGGDAVRPCGSERQAGQGRAESADRAACGSSDHPLLQWTRVTAYAAAAICSLLVGVM